MEKFGIRTRKAFNIFNIRDCNAWNIIWKVLQSETGILSGDKRKQQKTTTNI